MIMVPVIGVAFGSIFVIVGLIARLGGMKGLYLMRGASAAVPEAFKYIFLPLGIYIIISVLLPLMPIQGENFKLTVINAITIPMFIFVLILSIWQPRWLLPYWLRYLRDTYGYDVTYWLLEEARKEKIHEWQNRVSTHEGLVEWAEETVKRLGLQQHIPKAKEVQ